MLLRAPSVYNPHYPTLEIDFVTRYERRIPVLLLLGLVGLAVGESEAPTSAVTTIAGTTNGGGFGASPQYRGWSVVGGAAAVGRSSAESFGAVAGLGGAFNRTFSDPRDINADGVVDYRDVFALAQSWQTFREEPGHWRKADFDENFRIDANDLLEYQKLLRRLE